MKENPIDRNCPIPNSKSYKKKPRGYVAQAKNVEDDSFLVRWKESNVITQDSIVNGVQPVLPRGEEKCL